MKKFLSLLLAVVMLLGCIPAMAEDAEWKINQYTQLVSRKSAAEKIENIVVPAEIDGVAVRGVEYMAFNMYKNFKTLTIADTAVMLDRSVVRDLSKLEAINLPEHLLVIREGNFTNVPMLTSVVIPASVAVMQSSFNNCQSLTSITFEGMCPVFVTAGTYGMFTELPADCVIYVPDNQVDAYKAAFADREDVVARIQPSGQYASTIDWTAPEEDFVFDAATGTITGYTGAANYLKIPATIGGVEVKHIAADAFVKCHSICCVIIPEGVETVGDWAFAGISLLSYVSLPSTLVSMGSSAFSSAYMSAITFGGETVPTFDASAFGDFKGDWQLILPYGSSQEYVDAFAAYLAPVAATGVVKASIVEPYKFPALDAEAGAPYIGNWTSVAVTDGTEYYGMDLLGMSMTVALNDDGTGTVDMDGDVTPGGWYVADGSAIFAPIMEQGGQPVPEEAIPFTLDENGRMCLDLGGLFVLMEKEGVEYAVPAIPEKPWPEFDPSYATYFIGTWDAIEYIVEGESYPAELIGPTTFVLNDDGSALMVEGDEEPYALRWFAEFGVAYVGETMSDIVEITFDGIGNIVMNMGDQQIVLAPHVEELTTPVVEDPTDFIGTWVETDGMGTLVINADGTAVMTYTDGTVYELPWQETVTGGEFTGGMWWGSPMELQLDGSLWVDGGWMIFVREGENYAGGSDDYDDYGSGDEMTDEEFLALLELLAQMEGMESAPVDFIPATEDDYIGGWICVDDPTVQMLLLEDDATLIEGTECYEVTWYVEDGVAIIDGMTLYTQEDWSGILDMGGELIKFERGYVEKPDADDAASGDEMSDEELLALLELLAQMEGMEGGDVSDLPEELQPYVGTWHMVYVSTGGLTGDLRSMGLTGKLVLNADGTGAMTGISDEQGPWGDDEGVVRFGEAGTKIELLKDANGELTGFLMYGTELAGYMVFSQDETAVWDPASLTPAVPAAPVATAAPAAPSAPAANGDVQYVGPKFVCLNYTSFGMTMDASMLGGEYAVQFHDNGTADFTMAGFTVSDLPYSVNADGAYVINYYGSMFTCVPTATGFDMDYYGTMMMHFVPAE